MESVVKVKNCKFVVKDPNDHIQKHWLAGNFYEAHGNGLLAYLNRNGYKGRCLDIGASIGNHTVYFEKVLGCDVTAIEPTPDSYSHLVENCVLNDCKATVLNFALGEKPGTCSMKVVSDNNVGMRQVTEGDDCVIEKLDNLVEGQFDFIKIDVEHYNTPLLKGAEKTLKAQKKCHVFIECETLQTLQDTQRIMSSYGYRRVENVKLNHTPTYIFYRI